MGKQATKRVKKKMSSAAISSRIDGVPVWTIHISYDGMDVWVMECLTEEDQQAQAANVRICFFSKGEDNHWNEGDEDCLRIMHGEYSFSWHSRQTPCPILLRSEVLPDDTQTQLCPR